MSNAQQATSRMNQSMRREVIEIVDTRIREAHVTREDFIYLTTLVRNTAEIQNRSEGLLRGLSKSISELSEEGKRTELAVQGLSTSIGELKEEGKRTEVALQKLAEEGKRTELAVQGLSTSIGELKEEGKRTERALQGLTAAQKLTEAALVKLTRTTEATRTELGGLARSVSYALENEAYRELPTFLKDHYGISLTEKLIRLELDGEEINILGRGQKNGQAVVVVGESELKLTSVGKLGKLIKKVAVARQHYEGECFPVMITHFARPQIFARAEQMGITIVQSFEW